APVAASFARARGTSKASVTGLWHAVLGAGGGLEPPTCCLQDSSGPSTACWRVASLQLRPDGSSSQYAPVGPSDAVWNDKWNDMDGGLRQPTAASQNPLEVGRRPEDT